MIGNGCSGTGSTEGRSSDQNSQMLCTQKSNVNSFPLLVVRKFLCQTLWREKGAGFSLSYINNEISA